ncbi:MAG: cysteine desulfurase [Myxococcota bacterium]|jgi:cysteine desulfurase
MTSIPSQIYLDYNATTPLLPEAVHAMTHALTEGFGNPSSGHWAGRAAKRLLQQARHDIGALVGASARDVVLLSGATEALNQVLGQAVRQGGRIVIGAVEHAAVGAALKNAGCKTVEVVPVEASGRVDPDRFLAAVDAGPPPVLAVLMAANNVTGIIQPVVELTEALRDRGVPFLVDAVQFAGKLPVTFRPDYLVLAGHKFGGPKGVGALVLGQDATLTAMIAGGGQEGARRGGTEAVPAVVGMGAAAAAIRDGRLTEAARLSALRDALEMTLTEQLPGSYVLGANAERLPNTSSFMLPPGIEADAVVDYLDQAGIAVSAGSACHADSREPSAVLLAMGITPDSCFRALRISLGHATVEADVLRLAEVLPGIVAAVRG